MPLSSLLSPSCQFLDSPLLTCVRALSSPLLTDLICPPLPLLLRRCRPSHLLPPILPISFLYICLFVSGSATSEEKRGRPSWLPASLRSQKEWTGEERRGEGTTQHKDRWPAGLAAAGRPPGGPSSTRARSPATSSSPASSAPSADPSSAMTSESPVSIPLLCFSSSPHHTALLLALFLLSCTCPVLFLSLVRFT